MPVVMFQCKAVVQIIKEAAVVARRVRLIPFSMYLLPLSVAHHRISGARHHTSTCADSQMEKPKPAEAENGA